jgi:hypothetical protein
MKYFVKVILFVVIAFYTNINAADFFTLDTLTILTENFTNCTIDSTVFINIDYPKIENKSNDPVLEKINKFLEDEFKQSISWYDEIVSDTSYFGEYTAQIPYSFETGYQIFFNSKEFLSIVLNHYQFTGGAHGNYFAVGYNIDMENGTILTLKDFIEEGSLDLLTYECEESILETYQANSLMEAGLFENEIVLSIDQDFYTIPGALVLQFDPYEIGPYAMGEIIAEIPFEKIIDILKEDLPFDIINSLR